MVGSKIKALKIIIPEMGDHPHEIVPEIFIVVTCAHNNGTAACTIKGGTGAFCVNIIESFQFTFRVIAQVKPVLPHIP